MENEMKEKLIASGSVYLCSESQTNDKFGPIVVEISKAIKSLGGKSDILAIVGSWRDTMSDQDTLEQLKDWNNLIAPE